MTTGTIKEGREGCGIMNDNEERLLEICTAYDFSTKRGPQVDLVLPRWKTPAQD